MGNGQFSSILGSWRLVGRGGRDIVPGVLQIVQHDVTRRYRIHTPQRLVVDQNRAALLSQRRCAMLPLPLREDGLLALPGGPFSLSSSFRFHRPSHPDPSLSR